MKTIVIRVGAPDKLGYPVELLFDHGSAAPTTVAATALIPLDLAPERQVTAKGLGPLTVDLALTLYPALVDDPELALTQAVGRFLFYLLLRDNVHAEWRRIRHEAPLESVRTYLDIATTKLRGLPWELMYDPAEGGFLFVDRAAPVFRGHPRPVAAVHHWPVRVMVVVGAPETTKRGRVRGASDIQVAEELDMLHRVFARLRHEIDVDYSVCPTRASLAATYRTVRPHVLHVIGHGVAAAEEEEAALVVHSNDHNASWNWSASEIKADLANAALRFAFLNACRTNDAVEREGLASLADTFFSMHVPAVLGTQGDVPGLVAAEFAGAFYEELATGLPIDSAVASARQRASTSHVFTMGSGAWSLPVLQMYATPEEVLPRKPERDVRSEIKEFVDRRSQQRWLNEAVGPAQPNRKPALLIVHGDAKSGKTALVKWCLQRRAWLDGAIRYVDLSSPNRRDFLGFIRDIRDGDSSVGIRAGLPPAAFDRFNAELNALLFAQPLPAPDAVVTGTVDRLLPLPSTNAAEELFRDIFAAFRKALSDIAKGTDLIIALDHITNGVLPAVFKTTVVDQFIQPVVNGTLGPLRLVLVVSDAEYKELELDRIVGDVQKLPVPLFAAADFSELALEYCRHCNLPDDVAQRLVSGLGPNWMPAPWKPGYLRSVHDIVQLAP